MLLEGVQHRIAVTASASGWLGRGRYAWQGGLFPYPSTTVHF